MLTIEHRSYIELIIPTPYLTLAADELWCAYYEYLKYKMLTSCKETQRYFYWSSLSDFVRTHRLLMTWIKCHHSSNQLTARKLVTSRWWLFGFTSTIILTTVTAALLRMTIYIILESWHGSWICGFAGLGNSNSIHNSIYWKLHICMFSYRFLQNYMHTFGSCICLVNANTIL